MIDEADEAMPGQSSSRRRSASLASLDNPPPSPGAKKRKPGPLPKDTPYRRPSTPPPGSPLSPSINSPTSSPDVIIVNNNDMDHKAEGGY